jgi:large subunit ribosomal protein L9
MRIILREEVPNLGKSGEVLTVKDGYGRNYLLPQGLALLATERNVKHLEHQKKIITARNAKLQKDAQSIADRINALAIRIERQAGDGGKLFGSVSTRDIEEAVRTHGVTIDRKKVVISQPIKNLGEYTVEVKLGLGVSGKLKLNIVETASASHS